MRIAIASDHAGFALKEKIKEYLFSEGMEVADLGTYSEDPVDYPVYGKLCADAVSAGEADRGIVICATGIGISIAANKVKGIRCALCADAVAAEMTRKHNDANMLAIGSKTPAAASAEEITKAWLYTEFEGGRHKRRTDMLDEM